MKRFTVYLVSLMLAISLTACGKDVPVEEQAEQPVQEELNSNKKEETIKETEPKIGKADKAGPEEHAEVEENNAAEDVQQEVTSEQLEGTWLMVSGEVEGEIWDAMPGYFETLVFEKQWNEDTQSDELRVDSESRDESRQIRECFYDYHITVLEEALYEGCGNDEWSVLLGEPSPVNEDGYPIDMEYYVTLTDENTILKQCFYTLDGAPAVSYQTYQRILPKGSQGAVEEAGLEGGDYEVIGYVDENGVEHDTIPGMPDFYLHLDISPYCTVSWWDEEAEDTVFVDGQWSLSESGGAIMMTSEDYFGAEESEPCFWFAGAVSEASVTEKSSEDAEMYLWYKNGIIKLQHVYGSGGENYGGDDQAYQNTMSDLEGNAFAAPEDTIFIMYGEHSLDFEDYDKLPSYKLSSAKDSQQILLTAVYDNTFFWYVDKEGFEVFSHDADAGESIILQIDVPEESLERLYINIMDQEVYFYDISQDTVDPENWYYITP